MHSNPQWGQDEAGSLPIGGLGASRFAAIGALQSLDFLESSGFWQASVLGEGQGKLKGAPLAQLAFDGDRPPLKLHKAFGNG